MCHAVSLHHLDTKNKNDARRRMKLVIRSCRATDNKVYAVDASERIRKVDGNSYCADCSTPSKEYSFT